MKDKQNIGLYHKFIVSRTDGQDQMLGHKHYKCRYFVLDLDHDPYAEAALKAYAKACKKEYPVLASDLTEKNYDLIEVK